MTDHHFVQHRTVLFGECDPGGIIYTPRVSDYVVEAGIAFLGAVFEGHSVQKLFAMEIAPPARKLSIEFLKPMRWDDELTISVAPSVISHRSFTLVFDGTVTGQSTFTAALTQVCVSTKTFEPTPLPDEFRARLEAWHKP